MNNTFDYEVPHKCQYESKCNEPASYYIWWNDYVHGIWVCQECFLKYLGG